MTAKGVIAATLRLTLVPMVLRHTWQRHRVTILCYHRPSPEALGRHAHFLERAYNLIPLRDLVAALSAGAVADLPPRALVLTLDDGDASNHGLAGVLATLSAPATIFLCTGLVDTDTPFWFDVADGRERLKGVPDEIRLAALARSGNHAGPGTRRSGSLSSVEIDEMGAFVDFQSHTVSHPILPRCDAGKAEAEIVHSKRHLEEHHGLFVYALAYPNGDHSRREVDLARDAGYACGLTVRPGLNDGGTDPFRLRRIVIDDDCDGVHVLAVKASGLWHTLKWLVTRGTGR